MIVRLARKEGRDAVFDVPAQLLRSAPSDPAVTVSLTDDPSVIARGRVREVAPQANPVTRTFEVKVGLTDPPPAMRLGATVTGRMEMDVLSTIEIPATALTKFNRQPAVWIVDPSSRTVSMRNVDVLRFDPAIVAVSRRSRYRRDRGHRRRAGPASRPEGPPARVGAMTGFNLSEWALKHRSLIVYLMIVAVAGGTVLLLPARPQRGPVLRHQDDGGSGRLARRHRRGHAQAGHRAARAQAAGNAASSTSCAASRAPASRRSSSI